MEYKPITNEDIKIRVQSGAALTLTDEPTTANATYTEYQITNPAKRVLDPEAAITVKVDADGAGAGTPTTVTTGFTIDRLAGKVIFDTAQPSAATVTISGKYLPMADAAKAYQFNLSSRVIAEEDTVFGQSYVSRVVIMRDHMASFGQWHVVNQDMLDEFESDSIKVVDIRLGAGGYRMWAVHATNEISGQNTSLQSETLQLQGTMDADGRVISRG
jgi:hypothetical protein